MLLIVFFLIMCLNDIEENKTNTTHLTIACCFATIYYIISLQCVQQFWVILFTKQ